MHVFSYLLNFTISKYLYNNYLTYLQRDLTKWLLLSNCFFSTLKLYYSNVGLRNSRLISSQNSLSAHMLSFYRYGVTYRWDHEARQGNNVTVRRVHVPESRAIGYSIRIEVNLCIIFDWSSYFIYSYKKTRFVGVVFMKTIWQPQLSLSYMNRLSSKVAKTTQLWWLCVSEWLTEWPPLSSTCFTVHCCLLTANTKQEPENDDAGME